MMRGWVILAALVFPAVAHGDTPLPTGTKLSPIGSQFGVSWAVPPSNKDPKVHVQAFSIDDKSRVWFGTREGILMSPAANAFLAIDKPFQDFSWLKGGALFITSDEVSRAGKKSDRGLVRLTMRPGTPLPARNAKLHVGAHGKRYLVARDSKARSYSVYELVRKGDKLAPHKIASFPNKVTAVTGDRDQIFVAMGRLVVRLKRDKSRIEGIYAHPVDDILQLAYTPEAGLFYATEDTVGFIGDTLRLELMTSPNARLRAKGKDLFVLLPKSWGVLRFKNLNRLKRLDKAAK